MTKALELIRKTVAMQARIISHNPIIGAGMLLALTILIVFWLPAKAYSIFRLPMTVSIPVMFVLHAINLFMVFRKLRF